VQVQLVIVGVVVSAAAGLCLWRVLRLIGLFGGAGASSCGASSCGCHADKPRSDRLGTRRELIELKVSGATSRRQVGGEDASSQT